MTMITFVFLVAGLRLAARFFDQVDTPSTKQLALMYSRGGSVSEAVSAASTGCSQTVTWTVVTVQTLHQRNDHAITFVIVDDGGKQDGDEEIDGVEDVLRTINSHTSSRNS